MYLHLCEYSKIVYTFEPDIVPQFWTLNSRSVVRKIKTIRTACISRQASENSRGNYSRITLNQLPRYGFMPHHDGTDAGCHCRQIYIPTWVVHFSFTRPSIFYINCLTNINGTALTTSNPAISIQRPMRCWSTRWDWKWTLWTSSLCAHHWWDGEGKASQWRGFASWCGFYVCPWNIPIGIGLPPALWLMIIGL